MTARYSSVFLLVALIVTPTALAHDSPEHDSPPAKQRGRAVLAKIEHFQASVKEKLKQTLMPKTDESYDHTTAHSSPRSSRYHDIHAVGGRDSAADSPIQVRSTAPPAHHNTTQHQWIDANPEVNATQYREILEPTTVTNAAPFPEPLRPVSRRPISSESIPFTTTHDPYPVPHDNGYSQTGPETLYQRDPVISGSRLGQGQVTATEKALNLMRENELLRASRDTLTNDNQRLRETLQTTQDLLARSNQAIEAASEQLNASDATNQRLTQKIADMESQHKRYLMDTERMLNSLRDELDEVLVSEIGHVGN